MRGNAGAASGIDPARAPGRLHSSGTGLAEPDPHASYVAIALVRFAETTPINAIVSHAVVSPDKVRLREALLARRRLRTNSCQTLRISDSPPELNQGVHLRQHLRYGDTKSRKLALPKVRQLRH
jgi:hypothetical protein